MAGPSVGEAIRAAAARLEPASDTARLDAEVLMAHALGVSRSAMLLGHMRDDPPADFAAMVERRMRHEPVAYITGTQEFYGLPFRVGPGVLIPRGDSETLVEVALAARPAARRVLDLGTGSGALLLAVLHALPEATGTGLDRSEDALAVAEANARALGLSGRACLRRGEWHAPGWQDGLDGPFDLVLANPPYVEDAAPLAPSVRDFEPAGALFAGADGLDDYRVLLPGLAALMAPGGLAAIEIGASQSAEVTALAAAQGFRASVHADLAGRPRVVALSRKGQDFA